jgi:hypothetical protein
MLELAGAACADTEADATPKGMSAPAIASEAAIATVRLRGREVIPVRNMFLSFG